MLGGRDDKVKDLDHIVVKFYAKNLQEVTYVMVNDEGELEELSTSQFQARLRAKAQRDQKEQEVAGAKAYATKLFKRCLLELPYDDVEYVRKVQAMKFPKPAESVLGLTQEAMKQKGFNNPDEILLYWSKMPATVVEKMDEFQEEIFPGHTGWGQNLGSLIERFNERKEAAAKQKAKKAALKAPLAPGANWADSMEKPKEPDPVHNVAKEEEDVKITTNPTAVPPVPKRGTVGKLMEGMKSALHSTTPPKKVDGIATNEPKGKEGGNPEESL
jgi:hypothetical protein